MNILKIVRGTILPVAIALTFLATFAMQGADWDRFRGPNGSGTAAEATPAVTWSESQNLRWKTELPGPGTSSPIVVDARVFVTCYSGYGDGSNGDIRKLRRHLVCVNRADGKIAWSSAISAAQPEDNYGGFLTEHGYASHTPASDGERVYVFFGKSGTAAFDLAEKKLWQTGLGTDSNRKNWGSASSPVLNKDYVIINASEEGHAIVALEKKTGKIAWKAEDAALAYSFGTPVVVEGEGRTGLVFSLPGELWGMNPDTGKLRWFAETGLPGNIAPSVVAGDGVVYAFGGFPKLGASATGRGGKPFYASAMMANGLVYAVSRQNGAFVFEAKPEFRLVAQNRLAGDDSPFNASPALADRQLFLRSNRALDGIEATLSAGTEKNK